MKQWHTKHKIPSNSLSMKTAGIITIHDIINYGSIFQAFATQEVFSATGLNVEIIDYRYPNVFHNRPGSFLHKSKSSILKSVNVLGKSILPGNPNKTLNQRFNSFKKDHYKLSSQSYPTVKSILENPPFYDLYIAGSDQIWRPEFVKNDPAFLLQFAKHQRKISYASSFGCHSIPSKYKDDYTNALRDFSSLSVRETSGAAIIANLLGKNVPVVLDPTLLLDNSNWSKVMKPVPSPPEYILCYGYQQGSSYMEALALHLSAHTGLPVVRLFGRFYDAFRRKIRYVLDAGPAECLQWFNNATMVVGQSFHATAFSVNFQKPFWSILRGNQDHDSRQKQFLEHLGLENRLITTGAPFPSKDEIKKTLDFNDANNRLREWREISNKYIHDSIVAALLDN